MDMESDREETLSLSDLQLSGDDPMPSEESFSSSSSSFTQDFFGFFNQEWSSTTTSSVSSNPPPQDILFCGKVIHSSSKQPVAKTTQKQNEPKKSLMRWNSDSYINGAKKASVQNASRSKSHPVAVRKKDQRVSELASCAIKSRWQAFVFGSGRFPLKMELSDMRSRQLRRQSEEEESGSRRSGKRLSTLIRVLGCGGGFSTEEMLTKASYGYISPV